MKLIATGTGRCGTGWMAATLRRSGIDCGHELVFSHTGPARTQWEADSSWMAVPHLDCYPDAVVIVVVRDPVLVIQSMLSLGLFRDDTPFRRFIYAHTDLAGVPELEAANRFYVDWNRRAVAHANIVVDIASAFNEALGELLGVEITSEPNQQWNTREARYPVQGFVPDAATAACYEEMVAYAPT